MQEQTVEVQPDTAASIQEQEEINQLDYIARYVWSIQCENAALRQRIALLEAV